MSEPSPGYPPRAPGPPGAAPYREVTVASIVFGIVFGGIMNAAITYAGLKIGFTLGGSAIAAVLGFGVLRGILRKGSILETNIGQTIASAVNTTNAGIIFTVPVLLLVDGATEGALSFGDPNFWWITLACIAGALLGCVFIVPLRKQMLDIERLRFPSAVAVGAILKSPGAGTAKSVVLLIGIGVGALIFLPTALPSLSKPGGIQFPGYGSLGLSLSPEAADGTRAQLDAEGVADRPLSVRVDRDGDRRPDLVVTHDRIDVGRTLGLPDYMQLVFAIAPFALGAGYLTGRAGLVVLAGGVLAYMVLNPLAFNMGWMPETVRADQAANFALANLNRPLGIGLLLGGALMGVIAALPAIREGFRAMFAASRSARAGGGGAASASDDELGWKPLLLIAIGAIALLLLASEFSGEGAAVGGLLGGLPPFLARAIVALVAVAWIWFAGIIIAQCTGMTDWSPISGLALLTVVLVMFLAGKDDIVSAVMLGAALCVAISVASDMMADLKTGYIVGAVPKRQQIWEIITAAIGPVITMATLVLIVKGNLEQGQPPIGGESTPAPQAQALNAVIAGVRGGEMPYALYGMGGLVGILLGIGLFPGLGVLVGLSMYLPVFYILTYGLGCIANIIVGRIKGRAWAEEWGVPFCAGLIVGEAVLQLLINIIVVARSA